MTDLTAHADTLDHLERAIRERDLYRLMYRAALDQLHDALTGPRRYERMVRSLTEERAEFIKHELCADIGVSPFIREEKRREPPPAQH